MADRAKFDGIQAHIRELSARLAGIEAAIIRLNEMSGAWYEDLYNKHAMVSGTEAKMNKRIRDEAALIMHRSGKPMAEALQDPEFLKRKTVLEAEIAQAKAIAPELKEIDGILKVVGC